MRRRPSETHLHPIYPIPTQVHMRKIRCDARRERRQQRCTHVLVHTHTHTHTGRQRRRRGPTRTRTDSRGKEFVRIFVCFLFVLTSVRKKRQRSKKVPRANRLFNLFQASRTAPSESYSARAKERERQTARESEREREVYEAATIRHRTQDGVDYSAEKSTTPGARMTFKRRPIASS